MNRLFFRFETFANSVSDSTGDSLYRATFKWWIIACNLFATRFQIDGRIRWMIHNRTFFEADKLRKESIMKKEEDAEIRTTAVSLTRSIIDMQNVQIRSFFLDAENFSETHFVFRKKKSRITSIMFLQYLFMFWNYTSSLFWRRIRDVRFMNSDSHIRAFYVCNFSRTNRKISHSRTHQNFFPFPLFEKMKQPERRINSRKFRSFREIGFY